MFSNLIDHVVLRRTDLMEQYCVHVEENVNTFHFVTDRERYQVFLDTPLTSNREVWDKYNAQKIKLSGLFVYLGVFVSALPSQPVTVVS